MPDPVVYPPTPPRARTTPPLTPPAWLPEISPRAKLYGYVLAQVCNGVLLFAKLNPEQWPHIVCCVVIFVMGSLGLLRRST